MSDSVQPHRWRPTRLPRPWDSPGKNTGVVCHFLLQCMKGKSESEVAQLCPTLSDPMVCSLPGSSVHGIFQARVLEWGAIAFSNLFIVATKRLGVNIQIPQYWHKQKPSSLRFSVIPTSFGKILISGAISKHKQYFIKLLKLQIVVDILVQFSHAVMSNALWPHGLQHTRLPCPSPTSKAYSNSCP